MSAAGKMKNWLLDRKDNSVSLVLEKLLRTRLEPYGQVLELKINSRLHAATVQFLLKGESEPVTVQAEEYELISGSGATTVVLRRATASRAWLERLMQDFLIGKRFTIPEEYAPYARLAL